MKARNYTELLSDISNPKELGERVNRMILEQDSMSSRKNIIESVFEHMIETCSLRPKSLREGQHLFNVAFYYFPNEVNLLTGSDKYDCFYNDNNIKIFKERLKELIYEHYIKEK